MAPTFLELPVVPGKPRRVALSHVLDSGLSVDAMRGVLASYRDFVDFWKFGWGTSYVEPQLALKLQALRDSNVVSCMGGTLLEIAWAQGKADECLSWALDVGFEAVEVSRGTVAMTLAEKQNLVRRAAKQFTVVAETGYKSAERLLLPQEWNEEMAADLSSGASFIVAEGRESGTVGVYDSTGKTQEEIVEAAVSGVGVEKVIFEAPRKDQQAWFIERFGPEVNLGNISVNDILALQTLRLGLRADTAHLCVGRPESASVPP